MASLIEQWPLRRKQANPAVSGTLSVQVTGAGWGFLAMMLCSFLMSVNYSNNLIFAMTFLLSAIMMVGFWQTRQNLMGLEVQPWRCSPVFSGQAIDYEMVINHLGKQSSYGLELDAPVALKFISTSISAGQHHTLNATRTTEQRGIVPESPIGLVSRFPLGLFEAKLALSPLPECLVYAKPMGSQALPELNQGSQAHQHAESGSFTSMRRYAAGDPLSRIAWQALARTDELHTKEFDGAIGDPALWLNWNRVLASSFEAQVSQLCQWVLECHRSGREYGVELRGAKIPPGSGEVHRNLCLKTLATCSLPGSDQ